MPDSSYQQTASGGSANGWQAIKLRDIGDGTYGLVTVNVGGWDSAHISSATTTTVKSGAGVLGSLVVNRANSLSTITIYNNTAGAGSVIAAITHPLTVLSSQYPLAYNCKFTNGLTIVTSSTDDITVTYM